MVKVLVNATAAKEGGALTILNRFCTSKKDCTQKAYVIMSPIKPSVMPFNAQWIQKSTNGFYTLYFALILSWFFARAYGCKEIISFSNVNTLLPIVKKTTYFHNLLIIFDRSIKFRVLRFVLSHLFQSSSSFIFQTPYVRDEFVKCFKYSPSCQVLWPGISSVQSHSIDNAVIRNLLSCKGTNLVFPVMDIKHEHKNFKLIVKLSSNILAKHIKFFVPVDELPEGTPKNIISCGKLNHIDFLTLVKLSDGVVVASEYETLCLPIFESLLFNKPAFVLSRDYLVGLKALFGGIPGLYTFTDSKSFYVNIEKAKSVSHDFVREAYTVGNWNF